MGLRRMQKQFSPPPGAGRSRNTNFKSKRHNHGFRVLGFGFRVYRAVQGLCGFGFRV